jgi:hypothetical protein
LEYARIDERFCALPDRNPFGDDPSDWDPALSDDDTPTFFHFPHVSTQVRF